MSEQVPAPPAPKNPFARLAGVIVSPGETFAEVSRSPGWIPPFVIYLVVFLVCFGVYAARADWVALITDQLENSPFMKLVPEANRDQTLAKATEGFRKLTTGQQVATNLINVGSGTLMVGHFFTLIWTTLFVMMGSLKDLKLGRAWGRFLLCLLVFAGYLIVYGIASFVFKDSPGSSLLLSGTAAVAMIGAWIWILDGNARGDVELHRMLSVVAFSTVVLMLSSVALMVASLMHEGAIQVGADKLVPSSLGAVMAPDNAVARALFNALDLFVIWFLVTLTIGFRTVTRLTTGMAASMTFLPWALIVMVKIAWAAVFG